MIEDLIDDRSIMLMVEDTPVKDLHMADGILTVMYENGAAQSITIFNYGSTWEGSLGLRIHPPVWVIHGLSIGDVDGEW